MKQLIVRCVSAMAIVAAFAAQAAADSKCSSVNIQVKNMYHDPVTGAEVDIRVVDFQYWDDEDDKGREESTDNKRINYGQTAVWTKNLEYVGGESAVKIKVYFKYDQAGAGWSTDHSQTSASFTCTDGRAVAITID